MRVLHYNFSKTQQIYHLIGLILTIFRWLIFLFVPLHEFCFTYSLKQAIRFWKYGQEESDEGDRVLFFWFPSVWGWWPFALHPSALCLPLHCCWGCCDLLGCAAGCPSAQSHVQFHQHLLLPGDLLHHSDLSPNALQPGQQRENHLLHWLSAADVFFTFLWNHWRLSPHNNGHRQVCCHL